MDVIWYAVRCKAGMEQQTAEEWNQRHDGKACRAFIITYEKMKRYEGSWHLICEPLLSGYFFLKTEESKVLEEAQDSIPIDSGEERFLMELGGRDHHVPMSRGYIREGKTCVTEGPLCGHESQIQKSTDINVWRIWTAGWISIREKDSGLALKLYQRAKIVFPNRKCGQDKKFQKHLW